MNKKYDPYDPYAPFDCDFSPLPAWVREYKDEEITGMLESGLISFKDAHKLRLEKMFRRAA